MGRQRKYAHVPAIAGAGGGRLDPGRIGSACREQYASESRFPGFPWICPADRRTGRRGGVGLAIAPIQIRPRQSWADLRGRTLEPVAPPELFLRMALLARLSADRDRLVVGQPAWLDHPAGARLHVLGAVACF